MLSVETTSGCTLVAEMTSAMLPGTGPQNARHYRKERP
jgi:hypothetical protein